MIYRKIVFFWLTHPLALPKTCKPAPLPALQRPIVCNPLAAWADMV